MASESGRGQTGGSNTFGVEDIRKLQDSQPKRMGRRHGEGEMPVGEDRSCSGMDPEYRGTRGTPWEAGGTTLQA